MSAESFRCRRSAGFLWLVLSCVLPEVAAQSDLPAAQQAVEQFRLACEQERCSLWSAPLWGRLLLVEPKSRLALATGQDPDSKFDQRDGLFFGRLPPEILLANTSVRWGGNEWAMVLLPLPQDPFSRIRLLAHESFHRLQAKLDLKVQDSVISHLDDETGRVWLRMELRALARALRSDGKAARIAANDVLAFHTMRHNLHPSAEEREAALEIQEGLAEYTRTVVALRDTGESIGRVARGVEAFEDQASYARSFAYATGPALGLLLDRYLNSWRKTIKRDSKLAGLLAAAVGFRKPADVPKEARQRAEEYGYRAVASHERERAVRQQRLLAEFRARFLEGPTLGFPKTAELRRVFNPNNLVSLGEHGTVYPTGTFTSTWGRLQVDDVGALLAPDNQSLRVQAPADPSHRPLTGPGWKLELAPGWIVRPGGHKGDFEVVQER